MIDHSLSPLPMASGLYEDLILDMVVLILNMVRDRPFSRARLRCVSKQLYQADPLFIVPAWAGRHADLARLPEDTAAWRYYMTFLSDACAYVPGPDELPIWEQVSRPLTIEWDTRPWGGQPPRNELRLYWPLCYVDNILHVKDLGGDPSNPIYYVQGSVHNQYPIWDKAWDEYMGTATCHFRALSWSLLTPDHCSQMGYGEPVWE